MIAAETASEQAVSALIAAHADVNIKANDKVRTTLVALVCSFLCAEMSATANGTALCGASRMPANHSRAAQQRGAPKQRCQGLFTGVPVRHRERQRRAARVVGRTPRLADHSMEPELDR